MQLPLVANCWLFILKPCHVVSSQRVLKSRLLFCQSSINLGMRMFNSLKMLMTLEYINNSSTNRRG